MEIRPFTQARPSGCTSGSGFQVLGTVPRAFRRPVHGRVGLHLMYFEF